MNKPRLTTAYRRGARGLRFPRRLQFAQSDTGASRTAAVPTPELHTGGGRIETTALRRLPWPDGVDPARRRAVRMQLGLDLERSKRSGKYAS